MAVNYVWHVLWRYTSGGKILDQYPLQSADFIANALASVPGGDGSIRPDTNDLQTRISTNFTTPAGATIVLVSISTAQRAFVYS